jgi:hypothetical protein
MNTDKKLNNYAPGDIRAFYSPYETDFAQSMEGHAEWMKLLFKLLNGPGKQRRPKKFSTDSKS